jgi:organic radical activating enzyme
MPFVGMQASHIGNKLCCSARQIIQGSVKEFWHSEYIKDVRQKMLKGEVVPGCSSCYQHEAQNQLSMRQRYNNLFKDEVQQEYPQYFDLDFSNLCNLQCIMCGPKRSSQWTKELGDKHVKLISQNAIDEILEMSRHVKHLSLQGGEPSIMPEFEYLLQKLVDDGLSKNITIDCISNLTNVKRKFYTLLESFKTVDINVSVDAHGRQNDYIRFPSKFETIEKNLHELSKKRLQVNLQITIQVLSMFEFYDFLKWIAKMHDTFETQGKKLGLDVSFVHFPRMLDITTAPNTLKKEFINQITSFKKENTTKFPPKFAISMSNLEKTLVQQHEKENIKGTIEYIEELDQRRSIKITNYIPKFYNFFKKSQ